MKKFDLMSLDGRQLALLVAIYEHNSVSAAAAAFDTTQSSASHILDKLRTCLGDPLFVRSGRSLEPTERAHELIPLAREIVAQYEGMMSPQAYVPAEDNAPFTIAVNVTEFIPEIRDIRKRILAEAPRARIRFLELGSREQIERLLAQNIVDLVVTVRATSYPPFVNRKPLAIDDFLCFFDPAARPPPDTVEAYCAAEHGVLDFGGTRKSTVEVALDQLSLRRNVTLAAASVMAMGELIRGTESIMTMQSRLRHSAFSNLQGIPPPFPMPNLFFDMVWHRRSEAAARNKWLRNIVTEVFDSQPGASRLSEH